MLGGAMWLAAALSTAAGHTRLLPRWLATAGFPAAVLMLANTLLPMAVIALWYAAVAITLPVAAHPPRSQ